jgi:myo-inositol-1(or 4)-monophosphatase
MTPAAVTEQEGMTDATGGRLPWERGLPEGGGSRLLEIEERAAQMAGEAGALLLDLFRGPLEVEYKDKHRRDPVSQADRRAEEYLRRAIHDAFPDHAVLGEEGSDTGSGDAEYTWVLDPLDGTTNFVNGLPLFAVSAGVLRWGHPAVGAIWSSVSPTGGPGVFSARAGGGARLDGSPITLEDGRPGGKSPALRLAAVPGSAGHRFGTGGRPTDPRTLGSIAVEAALVACGVLQSAVFMRPKIWDVAAGVTIVREAGGSAFTRDGRRWHELTYFRRSRDRAGALKPLRDWTGSLLVGPPAVTAALAARLNPTALSRALRVARHPVIRRAVRAAQQLRLDFG